MMVSPYGVEICMYCRSFEGVAMFCRFLLSRLVLIDLGKFIVWFRPLFTAPAYASERQKAGACDNWE